MSEPMRVAGVMGWPARQSLSPRLHGFWLREHAINGAFVPLPTRPEDFSTVLRGIRLGGFRGVNVTVPHKEAAFALAQRLDPVATAAGAVNLLVFGEDGRLEGFNTDAGGLSASLVEGLGRDALRGKAIALLGAGGAARAAILALEDLGASEIRILNRDRGRAEALAVAFSPRVKAKLSPMALDAWPKAAGDVALALNTTSAGMKGTPALDLSLEALPKGAVVCDIVYNPLETDLLKRARTGGLRTVDGLGMLMHQAVPSFAAFFGVTPKVTPALRLELEKALADG
jgi:shikimate dehydrogenase